MGLLPRNVAKSVLTGGRDAACSAAPVGTSCAWSPWLSVWGSEDASPDTIREKNTPMDSAVPEFWNVDRIPEATPRYSLGTLPMIDDVFGAENMP